MNRYAESLGRALMAIIFLVSAYGKVVGYAGYQAYMDSKGVPGALLPLVIALEVSGGLALILGYRTRLFAFLLAGFCIVSAALFHSDFSDPNNMVNFMKNLAMAGGFLVLFANGAGEFSLDSILTRR